MQFNCVDGFNFQEGQEGNQLIILIQNQFDLSFQNVLIQLFHATICFFAEVASASWLV